MVTKHKTKSTTINKAMVTMNKTTAAMNKATATKHKTTASTNKATATMTETTVNINVVSVMESIGQESFHYATVSSRAMFAAIIDIDTFTMHFSDEIEKRDCSVSYTLRCNRISDHIV